jgi:hypothetical protein
MPTQTLVFVALPNGLRTANTLGLSLYLTPRLDAGATLAEFPDFLNWPGLIQKDGLSFILASGGQTATVAADKTVLRPDLWKDIFTPGTYVEPVETASFTNRLIVSYPVRDCLTYLKFLYQSLGTGQFAQEVDRGGLAQIMAPLAFRDSDDVSQSSLADAISNIRVTMWKEQHPDAAGPPEGTVKTASTFTAPVPPDDIAAPLSMPPGVNDAATRFAAFHNMSPAPKRPDLPSTAADFAKTLDFHKALTAITAYPQLMRALGLVFDVEVPATLCPASPSAGVFLTVGVQSVTPGAAFTIAPTYGFPQTAYTASASTFASAPASSAAQIAAGTYVSGDITDGLLTFSPYEFQLSQLDVDGAFLQALTLADNAAYNFANDNSSVVGTELNALRSSGIALIANGRGEQILEAITDNNLFNESLGGDDGFPRPLNVRDLTRGYRIDIFSTRTGKWHSLHRRNGTYLFGAALKDSLTTKDEEGFIQPGAASPADDPSRQDDPIATSAGIPQPGTDIFVHERVARWNGWSLSASRPGAALNRSPDPGKALDTDPTLGEPITPFKMTTKFAAMPGSLPELRFGDQYRLRARAVDLAGNSLPLSAPTPVQNALPAGGVLFPYLRFEPVIPPIVVLLTPPDPGATLDRMVIRSYNTDPSLDGVPTSAYDARHIAPPRTSERMAEQHGMFDNAMGHLRGDASTFQTIVTRDAYEIPQKNGVQLIAQPSMPVEYLPDPIARGAALRALPNTLPDTYGLISGAGALDYTPLPDVQPNPDSVTFIDFGEQWPERESFLMTLQEGTTAPEWEAGSRALHVGLEKASVAVVDLSCYLSASDLAIMAVWGWIRELFEAQTLAAMTDPSAYLDVPFRGDLLALLTRLVTEGGHEMITPARTLTLVHATQQPLGLPTFLQLPVVHNPANPIYASALHNSFTPITAWRSFSSHAAVLLGGMTISSSSTSKIDLQGNWEEIEDLLTNPGPTSTVHSDHVETIPIAPPEAGPIYAPASTERFVAVFIPQTDTLWFSAPFDHLDGVDDPTQVAAPIHNFADTKHRWVTYIATATSSFQEYFAPNLDFTRVGEPLVVDVPSSARPSPPDILYVVPTFGWETQETTNVKSMIRYGNSVRVYLNRPWYSSGDNEQLAVVLWQGSLPSPVYADREKFKPYFTQWGGDPIWQTGAVDDVPSVYDFPNAASTATLLSIDETPLRFDIAAHDVQYDTERQLWFCDIEFTNEEAYAPLVRLALARYQSHSITGVELSRVALADFVQLSPDRSAVLSINPTDPTQARVFVGGLAPSGPSTPLLTVTVEQQNPKALTDMGWEVADPTIVTVTEDTPAPSQPAAVLWSGVISFTTPPEEGSFRVVVREFERIPIYSGVEGGATEYGRRLVYAAIIPYDYPAISHA